MKFWKPVLFATILFSAVATLITYTSCEKNACNNVDCLNGGSCAMGTCHCPTGFEGYRCQSKTTDRYIGMYAGYTTCGNNLAPVYDTVIISTDGLAYNQVSVKMASIKPKILYGYISNNASTYSIVVTNNDSFANYARIYSITLQDNKNLNVHAYNLNYQTFDSSVNNCTFVTNNKFTNIKN